MQAAIVPLFERLVVAMESMLCEVSNISQDVRSVSKSLHFISVKMPLLEEKCLADDSAKPCQKAADLPTVPAFEGAQSGQRGPKETSSMPHVGVFKNKKHFKDSASINLNTTVDTDIRVESCEELYNSLAVSKIIEEIESEAADKNYGTDGDSHNKVGETFGYTSRMSEKVDSSDAASNYVENSLSPLDEREHSYSKGPISHSSKQSLTSDFPEKFSESKSILEELWKRTFGGASSSKIQEAAKGDDEESDVVFIEAENASDVRQDPTIAQEEETEQEDERRVSCMMSTNLGWGRRACKRMKIAPVSSDFDELQGIPLEEALFKCCLCDKTFAAKSDLLVHMGMHSNKEASVCPICNKEFEHRQTLYSHVRLHSGQKPLKCRECGELFARSSALISHLRAHAGQQLLICCQCGQAFAEGHSLAAHMLTHKVERSFQCRKCKMVFQTNRDLSTHLRSHRPNILRQLWKGLPVKQCP